MIPPDLPRLVAEAELASARKILNEETNRAERAEAELAAEREKVRVLRLACERIVWQRDKDHDANPISAGGRMYSWASKVLAATEDKP